jgi:protein involved in polysaccharide export with SLBB domain
MRALCSLPLIALVVAISHPLQAQESRASSDQSVLSPGDSVRIVVWRKPEFSGDFVVAPNGSITHPLYRSVQVGGVPFATAEANVRRFLARFEENPEFVMEPLVRVAISGEVERPQVFALRPETTIAEAVARAGGTTQAGARNHVRLRRLSASGQQNELIIDLTDPSGGSGMTPVRSGDQIVVDRRKSFMRDILLPTLGVIGSVASVGLLIDRITRDNNPNNPN